MDQMPTVSRKDLLRRWEGLKQERSSWIPHWQEISSNVLPRSGRFFTQDRNRGERRHNKIYDSTGTKSLRILAAGMMAGMTSPARPWFRLTTPDEDLADSSNVRLWLSDVTRLMTRVFAKSNTYRALHMIYEELGAFGTGSSIVLPDFNDVIRHYSLTTGEYAIAVDHRGMVNTLYREFDMTAAQIVAEFGIDKVSIGVQSAYRSGALDKWFTIIHAIEPRSDRDPRKLDSKNMAYRSVYFEYGGKSDEILRESGFNDFVGLSPRWQVAGGDIYGNSPAMEALGDIKQLRHEQLRKAEVIDKQTNPPLQIPSSMKERDLNMLPGGSTFIDMNSASARIQTAYDVRLDLSHLLVDIQDVRQRITSSFYADMFLMLANQTDARMTATEVAERHEEKLLMLGPVLERLHNELLDPLINMTFNRMVEAGIVPPAPQELAGQELSVEFVSMLAQAQRAVGTNSVDRFVGNLGAVAQFKPEVLDKFDADHWADSYSDMLGMDPKLIVPSDKVVIIRQQRAQQAQQQMQAEAAAKQSQSIKNLSQAQTSQPSALTNVIDMFSGYNTPQAAIGG